MSAETAQTSGYRLSSPEDIERLDFGKLDGGLMPQVAQDAYTGEVLMLGYANAEAVRQSLEEGELWFWSRSRQALWRKGETSGNTLELVSLHADCDADALLALVAPNGPICHTGSRSCFGAPPALVELGDVIASRERNTEPGSYTAKLMKDRNLRFKKLGEETAELVLACADSETERIAEEAADLIYHAFVACRAGGVDASRILKIIGSRLPCR